MDRSIPLLLIGLVFGGGIGFTVAAANGITLDGHDHSDPAHHGTAAAHNAAHAGAAHAHGAALDLPAGATAPAVAIEAFADPASGWNLHIMADNFRYAPEHASGAHVPGEGHAHVYVNGEKLGRVYGPWVHLAALPNGPAEVKVTLNSNDHRALAVNGKLVEASLVIGD